MGGGDTGRDAVDGGGDTAAAFLRRLREGRKRRSWGTCAEWKSTAMRPRHVCAKPSPQGKEVAQLGDV